MSCNIFLFFGSSEPQKIKLDAVELSRFENLISLFDEDLKIKGHLQGEMLRSLLKRSLILSTRMAKADLPEPAVSNVHMNIIREYNLLEEKHFREYHQ